MTENGKNVGPGLYVHVPFCASKCRYCSFYSVPAGGQDVRIVIGAMLKELEAYESFVFAGADTVYVGGGSPSVIPEDELARLLRAVKSKCPKVQEFTVEVNPGQVTFEKLQALREAGVNRLSMGAQSFNDNELAFLGRRHSSRDVMTGVALAREEGFDNISLDLIFALPGSDMASWKRSLDAAVRLEVEHISAYALTYEAGTPLYASREKGDIEPVSEEKDRGMYEAAIDFLAAAGYGQYEISNFAREGFECRHNLKYWANDEYVGIGPAAASWFGGTRWSNIANIDDYVAAINGTGNLRVDEHRPGPSERACETAVLNLRRTGGILLYEYRTRTGFDAMDIFTGVIRRYATAGMLRVEGGRLFLTREALPVADSVLCEFASLE
jgi:oxygen-independent coproporphyrinogen III oxidase